MSTRLANCASGFGQRPRPVLRRRRRGRAAEAGKLRVEMHDGLAAVRQELFETRAIFRQELTETRAALREDMANLRIEVLRWSFLFWLGQIAAVAGLLSYLR